MSGSTHGLKIDCGTIRKEVFEIAPKSKTTNADVVTVKFMKLHDDAVIPEKKTSGAAGLDLVVVDDYIVPATTTTSSAVKVNTGLAMELPDGYHAKLLLRSSTGANRKLRLANGTGIIDADYRGPIMALVENVGVHAEHIHAGDRLFQLIVEKNVDIDVVAATALSETERGEGGIGSTNNKEE